MVELDNPKAYSQYDASDMLSLLLGFPDDIEGAAAICASAKFDTVSEAGVIGLLGMGGSGIAGRLFAEYAAGELPVPVVLANGYELPAAVGENGSAIALSFSGNTAETLALTRSALERRARVVAVTSGGDLKRLCETSGASVIEIPGGRPPRTALAFLALPIFEIARRTGLMEGVNFGSLNDHMKRVKGDVEPGIPEDDNVAKQLARAIFEAKDTRIYGAGVASVVATRMRGQLAENSKVFASEHTFPEMCHNELVPFSESDNAGRLVIMLRTGEKAQMLTRQIELSLGIMREQGVEVIEIKPGTDDGLNGLFELIYLADFTSYYLAILNGQDPTAIDNIVRLKEGMVG